MLKEVYISPSVELVLLRADSQLASNWIEFDALLDLGDHVVNGENSNSAVDVDIDLGQNQ